MARPRVSDQLVLQIASQLTDRDRYLCDLVYEHQVLTTNQLCDAAFTSLITTRHRLARLHDLRVLDRFQPLRPTGSSPHHWVLDELGAAIVAANHGVDVRDLAWRRGRALALATSQRLDHLIGANGCFTGLLRAARHQPNTRLARWWSERRCAAEWGEFVRPDGHGIGVEPDPVLVLFVLPTHRREAGVRQALTRALAAPTHADPGAGGDVTVATGVIPAHRTAADAVWLLLDPRGGHRQRLRELARHAALVSLD